MNKTRSEECFEEIASRLEHEYIVNRSIVGDSDRDKEIFLYLLKDLASFCHLSWDDMNVTYRASQLSKWPPYHTWEETKAKIAALKF
jgi:hypothetical protein